jgi:hypothetical protein
VTVKVSGPSLAILAVISIPRSSVIPVGESVNATNAPLEALSALVPKALTRLHRTAGITILVATVVISPRISEAIMNGISLG